MADLNRFIDAQRNTYAQALKEIKNGKKVSHWIWYIFPQIKGLGHSFNSNFYGLEGLTEAKAYINQPLLNNRLRDITGEALKYEGDISDLMGSKIDAIKLQSSMTLFDMVSPNDIYGQLLNKFYSGNRCQTTIIRLGKYSDKSGL